VNHKSEFGDHDRLVHRLAENMNFRKIRRSTESEFKIRTSTKSEFQNQN